MKRLLAFCMALLMLAAVFAACSDNSRQDDPTEAEKDVSLQELLSAINTDMGISDKTVEGLKIIKTTDDLDRIYGISAEQIRQFGAERTSSKNDYLELLMVEANGEEAVTQIVNGLNSRLDAQRNTAKSYNPEAVEVLENCKVTTNGSFIYLVISKDQEKIEKMIEEALE